MSTAISSVSGNTAVVSPATTTTPKPSQPEAQPAPATDSVQLSKAAQAAIAVLKEARETPAQTTQEAAKGDLQARRLLSKEAAAHAVNK